MDGSVGNSAESRRSAVAGAARRRLVAHIAAGGSTDMAKTPLANDARVYTDPGRLARERRGIFLKMPLVAGLPQDIPDPGDILLFNELGYSVIVVRGASSKRERCARRRAGWRSSAHFTRGVSIWKEASRQCPAARDSPASRRRG
jgi:hypothetical protein